jgi:hypothetical protein
VLLHFMCSQVCSSSSSSSSVVEARLSMSSHYQKTCHAPACLLHLMCSQVCSSSVVEARLSYRESLLTKNTRYACTLNIKTRVTSVLTGLQQQRG